MKETGIVIIKASSNPGKKPKVSRSSSVVRAISRPLVVALAVACTVAPAANAAYTHKPLFQIGEVPAKGPLGESIAQPGPLGRMESTTVDSGRLWVAETTPSGEASRVDEFNASTGAFIAQPVHVEKPTFYGEGYGKGIAVGHGPGEPVVYIGGKIGSTPVVSLFGEDGALQKSWTGASVPGNSFGGEVTGIAVDNSSSITDAGKGNVYVAVGSLGVIDVFHPETNGEEHYVGQIIGTGPGKPFAYATRVAVNEASGEIVVQDGLSKGIVDIFTPTGMGTYELVRQITGPPPTGVFNYLWTTTVDSRTGDIYVAEFQPFPLPYRIDQFSPTGVYLGEIEDVEKIDPYALAVDPASHDLYVRTQVYGPEIVIPDVTTGPPASVKPESAVLSGTVNPDNEGLLTCKFEWGTSPAFGHTAPCSEEISNGNGPVPVQASLSGLERGVTYYYRLQASNANGTNLGESWQDQSFTTPGAIVREESVSGVTADSATLEATIDPAGYPMSYYFQYGVSNEYGQQSPTTAEAIGSAPSDVEVPGQHLVGLSSSTDYHYRVVALSETKPGELEVVYGKDEMFTTQPSSASFSLPNRREWELVTPPDKRGALIYGQNHATNGNAELIAEASVHGNAMIDVASAPTEAEPQGYFKESTILSTRGSKGGWSSQMIAAPHNGASGPSINVGGEYVFFSEDLSQAVMSATLARFEPLSPDATERTPFLRANYFNGDPNERCESSCYRPLVTRANDTASSFLPFGGAGNEEACPNVSECGPTLVAATPDAGHVALASQVPLTSTVTEPGSATGQPAYLYEWSDGQLQPLYLLPSSEGGIGVEAGTLVVAANQMAANGAVFFTYKEHLYLHDFARDMAVRLDVARGTSEPPTGGATFLYASSDGSRVLFSDSQPLTGAGTGGIYECEIVENDGAPECKLSLTSLAGGLLVDGSKDASYLYFEVAGEKLVIAHREGEVWTTTIGPYVGKLAGEVDLHGLGAAESPITETSPNGRYLTFMSDQKLTGYDNRDAVSGLRDVEVYLYDAVTNRLVCASCDPTGARPVGVSIGSKSLVSWGSPMQAAANLASWTSDGEGRHPYETRFVGDDGRLFFNTRDALLPQDVNGQQDVYEYEPAGVGTCSTTNLTYSAVSGGCVSLISSGASVEESAFMDASETGGDVFFITLAKLVPADYDEALDVYDAHECTTRSPCAPQTPSAPPPCSTGDGCKPSPTPQPSIFGAPASATFSGTGNVAGSSTKSVTRKSVTRAQRLARALRSCRRNRSRRRLVCERNARRRYGRSGVSSRNGGVRYGKRG